MTQVHVMRWPRLSEKRRVTQTKQMVTKSAWHGESGGRNEGATLCLIWRKASRLQEAPVTDL